MPRLTDEHEDLFQSVREVQQDLEECLLALYEKASSVGPEGPKPEEVQMLVTQAAVLFIEYKGFTRENYMAVEKCR